MIYDVGVKVPEKIHVSAAQWAEIIREREAREILEITIRRVQVPREEKSNG